MIYNMVCHKKKEKKKITWIVNLLLVTCDAFVLWATTPPSHSLAKPSGQFSSLGLPHRTSSLPFTNPPQLECVRMDSVLINHSYSSQLVHKHTLAQSKTCRRLWPNTQLLECAVLHSRVLREVITQKEAFSLWKRAESSCFYLRNLRVHVYLLHCFPYATIYTNAVGFLFSFSSADSLGAVLS